MSCNAWACEEAVGGVSVTTKVVAVAATMGVGVGDFLPAVLVAGGWSPATSAAGESVRSSSETSVHLLPPLSLSNASVAPPQASARVVSRIRRARRGRDRGCRMITLRGQNVHLFQRGSR